MGFLSTTITPQLPAPLEIRREKDSSDSTIEYFAQAYRGTANSTAGWFIVRNTYKAADGGLSEANLANINAGKTDFSNIWEATPGDKNYESLPYGG